jgi:hypothetical protein
MVKPESQARQFSHRDHFADRKLPKDPETNANSIPDIQNSFNSQNSTAIEYQATPDIPNSEEVEDAFLKCYSDFIGTKLTEKTTWKSENFSQQHSERHSEKYNYFKQPYVQ